MLLSGLLSALQTLAIPHVLFDSIPLPVFPGPLILQRHGKLALVSTCVLGIVQSQSVSKHLLDGGASLLIRLFNNSPQSLQIRKLGLRDTWAPALYWLAIHCPLCSHGKQRLCLPSPCRSTFSCSDHFLTSPCAGFSPSSLSPSLCGFSLSQVCISCVPLDCTQWNAQSDHPVGSCCNSCHQTLILERGLLLYVRINSKERIFTY